MMSRRFWDPTIQALWFSLALAAITPCALAVSLDQLGRAYVSKPVLTNRAPLAAFAKAHPRDRDGAIALLTLAVADVDNGRAAEALENLRASRARLAAIGDYVSHYTAKALLALDRKAEALPELESVIAAQPPSPLRGTSVILAATLLTEAEGLRNPTRAVTLLRTWIAEVPQPRGLSLYATALEAAGDATAAAIQYQKLWHEYPLSVEAALAGEALNRLELKLGAAYPPSMPEAMLRRASLLMDGRQTAKAISELNDLLGVLGGADRELARVRIGAARYKANSNLDAFQYLSSLSVTSPEADAERLYYHLSAARRLDRVEDMAAALETLAGRHPASRWRLEALVSAGNYYLLQNKPAEYEPLYRACADSFPNAAEAPYCHWKVVWTNYLQRRPEAEALLREHLRRYSASSQNTPSALYFLGRLSERGGDMATARALYEQIASRFPGYFYAMLARDRLSDTGVAAAVPSKPALSFLQSVGFSVKPAADGFQADAATRIRIERARLLAAGGLDQLAESELRFGARTDSRPNAIAVEIAQIATRRGAPETALRYVKSLAPRYLNWSLQEAPAEFWKFVYPLPYRDSFEKHSRANSLDAFLMAGLVRQESEFNPRAVSRANAIGLSQIRPGTGRQISRNLRIGYRTSLLYDADANLRMGTWHLRKMIDSLNGDTVAALAAYNAGKSRADAWLTWGDFREPAEFIETIPFTETRDYVQIVLRNADMYRRLYGTPAAGVPSSGGSSRTQTVGGSSAGLQRSGALP
jgi:soluble lytic murein transglycosylase